MAALVKVSENLLENTTNVEKEIQFVIGTEDGSTKYLLAYAGVGDKSAKRFAYIQSLLPGGIDICGIAVCDAIENIMSDEVMQLLNNVTCETPVIVQKSPTETSRENIESVSIINADSSISKIDWKIEPGKSLANFVFARAKCHLPLSFSLPEKGSWKSDLHTEIENLGEDIVCDSTMFHLVDSSVLFSSSTCYGLPDSATAQALVEMTEADDDAKSKKRKDKKWSTAMFDVYTDQSNQSSLDKLPSCAPMIYYSTGKMKVTNMMLKLDSISVFPPSCPVSRMAATMCESLRRQLRAAENCICQYTKNESFVSPVPYHCQPMVLDALFTVMYPNTLPDEQLEDERRSIHECLCLPTDRPLFRKANQCIFADGLMTHGGYLVNVHENVPKSKVSGGRQYCVAGNYTYHHYMQDRFDDNKWGCAYRSLQTLVSWFKLQGYTTADVPPHNKIQQTLVDIGDKEKSFVGSRLWIGSMEVSFVLDTLLGVTSKILSVSSGAELSCKGRELASHFQSQGTPVMIGGGVLAHTILGVDYNETSGDISFLILDPHYTGGEDLKTIVDKGWCGWKGPEFWDQHAHYNMCLPQRPKVI